MRKLPELPYWETSTFNTQQFLGLNRSLSIADGEMADMLNMSGDNFPVLSTRKPRGAPEFDKQDAPAEFDGEISGMLGTDRLIVCHDGKIYVDAAHKAGYKTIMNDSCFHEMARGKDAGHEIYCQIEGVKHKWLCPTYRGKLYPKEMERIPR